MRSFLLASLAALTFGGVAHAQNARESGLTGQTLVKLCTPNDAKSLEGCEAYINGVADSAFFYQTLRPANGSKGPPLPGYICIPYNTPSRELRDKILGFIKDKADQGDRAAGGVILTALKAAYPCGQGHGGKP
jgi:hypothetical protein